MCLEVSFFWPWSKSAVAGGGAGNAAIPVLDAPGGGLSLGKGGGQCDGEDDDGFHGFPFLVASAAAR